MPDRDGVLPLALGHVRITPVLTAAPAIHRDRLPDAVHVYDLGQYVLTLTRADLVALLAVVEQWEGQHAR